MKARARLTCIAMAAFTACGSTDSVQPQATLYFSLDAPFCGIALPVQFLVDSVQIGTDTFRVNLAPNHTTSRGFGTAPGAHVLGARVGLGAAYYPWPATPDTVVTLSAGTTFTRVLPFYCS